MDEFSRGRYRVIDRETGNLPLYDDAPYGDDKPVIYKDHDLACEVRDALNSESV